ncbi:DNA repair exonuclease SbcCD nuclease subunit [Tumebacillus sp. BK434]|uniref:metallophosphoesterase family protein n=1 Tax=Tumebacillus sp. BK434 TaxID=2512169 RepID=UPI0010DB5B3A|nr:metallophosphoesterase [Tumebacillus sp. BK434]TCP57854.1 DNA repair exonuclease SbcCD nuclease subunit [Tumebacillus sp. BK434]
MREVVRIMQAGDLHLGTPFSGSGFPVEKARKRRRELLGTFRKLVEAVVEQKAELLLLTGDVFEADWVSEAEVAEVRQLLAGLNRPVLITPGNHDCLQPGGPYSFGDWPDNVHIFGPQVEAVSFEAYHLTVHGYGYGARWLKENPFRNYRVPEDGGLHIVMIHGSFDAPEGTPYLPISAAEVKNIGADYAAFGHYHQASVLLDQAGLMQAAYAGSLEPLGYDEPGEHGAFLLEVTRGGARVEWLPLAQRAYCSLEVDISGAQSLFDIVEKVNTVVPAASKGRDLLDITLSGALDPGLILDREDLLERLQDIAYHLRLVDDTHPDIDGDAFAAHSAQGRYVARLRERLESETDEAKRRTLERALQLGLLAYERGKVVNT